MALTLRVISSTSTTVTIGWDAITGAAGYRFYVDGRRVSSTQDGSKTQVKFGIPGAGAHTYGVEAFRVSDSGDLVYPSEGPPVNVTLPTISVVSP